MSEKDVRKPGRLALWFLPLVVAGGFLGALWWMRPRNLVVVETLTAVVAISVLTYTTFLGKREARRWDEVQRAGWAFGSTQAGWGYFATMVLLLVPPVMNRMIDLVNAVAERAGHHRLSPEMTNHVAVQLALWFGITLVMVMQGLASVVATVVWWRRMGRSGEQS